MRTPIDRAVTRILAAALLLGLVACGQPTVTGTDQPYEPRIVVEGLLMPGHPVTGIHVYRNLPVTANLRQTQIWLDADVTLVDEATGTRHGLVRHAGDSLDEIYYELPGDDDLVIEPGATYSLEVDATIDRRDLSMRATTTVPQAGFRIRGLSHTSLPYRPVGPDGEVVDVTLQIERAPGVPLYLMTVLAENPSVETFVYDNPFTDEDPDDLDDEDIRDFAFTWEWLQNPPQTTGVSTFNVYWWDLWFTTRHRIIVYAADENWARFVQTFSDVQEDDGNFHEPVFSIEGDGIGYFGAAIPDTIYIDITP